MTLDKLKAAVEAVRKSCPYYQFMVKHGKSPADGWKMVIPLTVGVKDHPDYVSFSAHVPAGTVYFINPRLMEKPQWPEF